MSPSDLHAFLAVAEELHFGRAAARLHITPPPLTRHIQKLEREMGARLFERTKRSVALTPAGRVLVDEARRLLAAMDTLPAQVQRAARGDTGVLRAGTISTALFSVARTFEAAMRKALPSVRLAWQVQSSAQQVDELRHNRLDLAFVHTPIEHEGLALRRVLREALVVALPATHPAARQRTVTLRALKDETFIVADRDRVPSYYDRFIAACHVAGFEPRLFHQRQTMVNFLGLVAIGAGVTVVPVSLTRVQVTGVAYVKLAGTGPFSELSVAWNPANTAPVLARALALLEGGTARASPHG